MNRFTHFVSRVICLLIFLLMIVPTTRAAENESEPKTYDYIFSAASLTLNGKPVEPKESNLNFEIVDMASDFWSLGICTIYKNGINAPTDAFFFLPVGLFYPITRLDRPSDAKGSDGLLSARARLFTYDGANKDDGFQPKAYQISLAYDAPMLWGVDLTWSGVFDDAKDQYGYLEGFYVRFTARIGWTVFD